VTELREGHGGSVPRAGAVLAGTAEAAEWLRAHALPGSRIATEVGIAGERGPLVLGPQTGVGNGGPRLLRAVAWISRPPPRGFHWPEDPEFFYRFGVRRNRRTLAGVTRDGRLLLVAVDGRRPDFSVRASFAEKRRRAAGPGRCRRRESGRRRLDQRHCWLAHVNRPSDPTGERPIGDAAAARVPVAAGAGLPLQLQQLLVRRQRQELHELVAAKCHPLEQRAR
jgi:Phosphodiester glycosidase